MTIKEIEARTGLPRANVRYYESQGLICPGRGENGYRDYSREDLENLLKIKLLRQVGFSLEEIAALRRGDLPMSGALSARMSALAGERERAELARQLCERLQEDQVDWAGLEAERYLSWAPAPAPVPQEAEDIRLRIPWRRYFARILDLTLYGTVWCLFCILVLRRNILKSSLWWSFWEIAVTLGMTVLLEPLLLHRFGTTVGKWIMGLKLTRSDGSFLSVEDARERTWKVLLMGLGLCIPLVSMVTSALSWLRVRWDREQPWELEDAAWSDGGDGRTAFWEQPVPVILRSIGGAVGINVLSVALIVGTLFWLATPRHHGPMTVAQFSENYNDLIDFSTDDTVTRLDSEGAWYLRGYVLDPELLGPSLRFETEDGVITALSFAQEAHPESGDSGRVFLPVSWASRILCALLGRREVDLEGDLQKMIQSLTQTGVPNPSQIDGWTILVDLQSRGYQLNYREGYGLFMVPVEGVSAEGDFIRYTFRVERIS